VRALEYGHLRGLRPAPGLAGIAAKLAREAPADLRQWFTKLLRILAPLSAAMEAKAPSLSDLARTHATAAELLAATDSESGASVLWRGPAGEAAGNLIAELIQDSDGIVLDDGGGYAELFRELAESRAVRPPYNRHRRLAILGPLEARLQDFDLVILGGLNEGTWPAEASSDPWLSRPMRESLGLEPPERRTGLAAHDFAMLAAMRSVLLTRSLKESGAPTNASRWILRIKQLAKGLQLDSRLQARNDLLVLARRLDESPREKRAKPPTPRPPVEVRPRQLRVTEIETWLRDPYAIYARRILKLKPLDPIDSEPGPAERGTAIHHALERFLRAHPTKLPPDALERLLHIGDDAFAEAGASDAVLALWRPRFERAARWFLAYEEERRGRIERSVVEAAGKLEIPSQSKFTLTGRADRIDWFEDGSAAILDYKTGRVPTDKQVEQLLAPQLPLEAAMLMKGGFAELKTAAVRALVHVRLTGGEPPGKESVFDGDATQKAMEALARLTALIARYDEPTQAYRSREMPFRVTDVGDYDHLARVREWSRGEDEE
jgi:ATP-dependent helicase/nuclease subunit B